MAKKNWYSMQAVPSAAGIVAEIRIYGEIGFWGMTAKDFAQELDAVSVGASEILVSINSVGGDVFDANAIYAALRRHPLKVTTRADGVAASSGSLIFMAGDERVMPENAMLMIHNAWIITGGTADELRTTADMMDKVRDGVVAAYGRSGQGEAEIIDMMNATTWLTALEAQALGFCTLIEEPVKLAASATSAAILAKHKGVPAALLASIEEVEPGDSAPPPADPPPADPAPADPPAPPVEPPPAPEPEPEPTPSALTAHVFAMCRERQIGHLAESILMSGALEGRAQADARIADAESIAGLCMTAKLADKAADFIRTGLGVEQVRARLFDHLVQASAGSISNLQRPENSVPTQSGPNPQAIYAARKAPSAQRR